MVDPWYTINSKHLKIKFSSRQLHIFSIVLGKEREKGGGVKIGQKSFHS